jgi:hypothetical protein
MDSCTDPKRFTLALSVGLFAAILAHALFFGAVQVTIPRVEQYLLDTPQTATPAAPPGGINFDSNRYGSPNTLPVNDAARDELKKQILGRRITPYASPNRVPNCPDGNCPPGTVPNAQPMPNVTPANQPNKVQPVKTTPRYSIELFVSSDQQSRALQSWFRDNATLAKWTTTCNHNIYTADNPLYKSRYAALIPADAFPVCLVTAPNGGHVYAADRYALPQNADALVTEISDATKLHQSIMANANNPLPQQPQPPVNAQTAQHPDPDYMEQCADGDCATDSRFPLLDRLRNKPKDAVQGLLQAIFSPTEFLMQVLIIAIGTFVIVYLLKTR